MKIRNLKKIIAAATVTAAVLTTVSAGSAPAITLYPAAAEVVELDRTADTVMCSDAAGNLWTFYGTEDYETGDLVALLMDGRGTDDIHDDRIISARYAGHLDADATLS